MRVAFHGADLWDVHRTIHSITSERGTLDRHSQCCAEVFKDLEHPKMQGRRLRVELSPVKVLPRFKAS